ncbi:hypothetical protein ACFLR4_03185 [Bacteroidota bacterium]
MNIISNIDEVILFLKSNISGLDYRIDSSKTFNFVRIFNSPESDYDFEIYFFSDKEVSITAYLRQESKSYEDIVLWDMPFEMADFHSSTNILSEVKEKLLLILQHPTRIIQRRRLFFWNFICEYQTQNGRNELYSMASIFSAASAPKIIGKEKIYYSRPKVLLDTD